MSTYGKFSDLLEKTRKERVQPSVLTLDGAAKDERWYHRLDSENLHIGTCRNCGHYPKTLFKDTRTCIKGACFRRMFKGLVRSLGYAGF